MIIKKLTAVLSIVLLYGVSMTSLVICCENTTGIEKYDKKRDNAFIAQRMAKDFPGDEEFQSDVDPDSEPLIVFSPVPSEHPEYKEYELEIEKLMGIPESAQLKEDTRWSQGIVLKIDKQLTFVYCISGAPVAFIRAGIFGDLGTISHLSTMEEWRGKGIGGKLLQHMISEMKKLGVKKIALSTSKKNDVAQRLYKKAGFTKVDDLPEAFAATNTEILVYYVQ